MKENPAGPGGTTPRDPPASGGMPSPQAPLPPPDPPWGGQVPQTSLVRVLRHREEGVAEIMLDRPEAMNSISSELARALIRACAEAAAAPEVRAVVLSAAGERAFCAGADLKERAGMSDADLLRQRHLFRAAFGAVLALPQPAIAAVHGFALGGGCELALSCDLVVADPTAAFGLPEVTVGLVPGGGGTQLALRRLGPGRAADLVLTGRRVGIDEAERLGLVDRRAASGQDGQAARELARQIAANSPVAVRAAKRALRHGWGVSLEAALDIEDAAWRTAALSADRREGIAAFAEKRPPVWPGE
jgi:enoyl-CoA hydratase/carnithine racemase